MTKVTFYQNSDNVCVGFLVRDHAGAGTEGNDIVCAAISALVINTVNSLEAFTEDSIQLVSDPAGAEIRLLVEEDPSPECTLLLNSLILGLQNMEDQDQYTEFIDIIFEEV